MMQLYKKNFLKVSTGCSQAPTPYQQHCFEGIGRDAGTTYNNDPHKIIQACSYTQEGLARKGCYTGAVKNAFWDSTGEDNALGLCKLLINDRKKIRATI